MAKIEVVDLLSSLSSSGAPSAPPAPPADPPHEPVETHVCDGSEACYEHHAEAWIKRLDTLDHEKAVAEIKKAYINMVAATNLVVEAAQKVEWYQLHMMALAVRDGGELVITDAEIEDLDGVYTAKRTAGGDGTVFKIVPRKNRLSS